DRRLERGGDAAAAGTAVDRRRVAAARAGGSAPSLLARRPPRARLLRDGAEDLMRITYLLEDTPISGRVRTALAQADALIGRGHRVRIATKGAPVTWRPSRAEWLYVEDFGAIEDEIVVADP